MEHLIGFWNLENLFDVEDSPTRPAWLQSKLSSELEGWNEEVLALKISQLVKGIGSLGRERGPDILGVCEVENEAVMDRLAAAVRTAVGRDYAVAHADTSEGRGIDVAFFYDRGRYEAEATFSHHVLKRNATRDLFQVNLRTAAGNPLVLIGNHWPSRRGGTEQSAPFRMMCGETLAYWHERIIEELGRDTAIVVMGDFNDEPFDRSVREYALSVREPEKLLNAREKQYFLNMMWEVMGYRLGTHSYDNIPGVLDQFWINRAILTGNGPFTRAALSPALSDEIPPPATAIHSPEWMRMNSDYLKPRRFGRPSTSRGIDREGVSDHFPILMKLDEAK